MMYKSNYRVGDRINFITMIEQEKGKKIAEGRVIGVYKNLYTVMTPYGYVTTVSRYPDDDGVKNMYVRRREPRK